MTRETRAIREIKVTRATTGRKEYKAHRVFKAIKETPGIPARQGRKAHQQGLSGRKAHGVTLAHEGREALPAIRVLQARRGREVSRVTPGREAQPVRLQT